VNTIQTAEEDVRVRVENVGGISDTEVTLSPGVNVLAGRNATNRTSLLQGIMAGLGSDDVSLKGDAEEGTVELSIGKETHVRRLQRTGGGVSMSGDPYLDDPEVADLFAFLLERNDARRAVARGDDLREIIMRPVDTEEIQAEIDRLEAEKREVESELRRAESLESDRTDLEAERERLQERIEETEAALEEKHAEIEEADTDLEEGREELAELEEDLEALSEARSDLADVRYRIDTERESIADLREERDELEERLASLPAAPTDERDELEAQLNQLRERKRAVDSRISQLQGLIQFNDGVLEGDELEGLDVLHGHGAEGDVTEQLVDDEDSLVCWTCGASTARDEVEATLERLRSRHRELVTERGEITDELSTTQSRRSELDEKQRERSNARERRDRIENEIRETEETIERLEERREEFEAEVERLDEAVEERRAEEVTSVIDLHAEANELELTLSQLESELDDVEDELVSIDERIDEREALRERRDEVTEALEEARTRIERLERQAVEEFNGRMEEVLSILEYDNLERVWIEQVTREEPEGRRTVERSVFALHIVRNTEDGTVYEDTVDHLSESEREVTGFVFALAGYLVHDVYEEVPFMLLDSLEAIDADRIARLIDYFREYAPYLVVALLPEDAAAIEDVDRRVTDI